MRDERGLSLGVYNGLGQAVEVCQLWIAMNNTPLITPIRRGVADDLAVVGRGYTQRLIF